MNNKFFTIFALAASTLAAIAAPLDFDFKDPKGVNNATFIVDGIVESTSGVANGISGNVTFDPQLPGSTTGSITVTTASLHVPNPLMDKHLHSKNWLDAETYPEIKFVESKLENVLTSGETTTAEAHGAITIKGVTKDIVVPVQLTYLKDKLSARLPGQKGDILVLRSHFSVLRSDFNIQPHQSEDKVSDAIQINLSIAGASQTQ